MTISQEDSTLHVIRPSDSRRHRELHGLTRALINNMVNGVSKRIRACTSCIRSGKVKKVVAGSRKRATAKAS